MEIHSLLVGFIFICGIAIGFIICAMMIESR